MIDNTYYIILHNTFDKVSMCYLLYVVCYHSLISVRIYCSTWTGLASDLLLFGREIQTVYKIGFEKKRDGPLHKAQSQLLSFMFPVNTTYLLCTFNKKEVLPVFVGGGDMIAKKHFQISILNMWSWTLKAKWSQYRVYAALFFGNWLTAGPLPELRIRMHMAYGTDGGRCKTSNGQLRHRGFGLSFSWSSFEILSG